MLEVLDHSISSFCCKNGVDDSFLSKWTNYVKIKTDQRITRFENNVYGNKHSKCLSSPDEKLCNTYPGNNFVVVSVDKEICFDKASKGLASKRCYVFVIAKELGLNNNSSIETYKIPNKLPANDIIDKNVRDLKIKFGINDIFVCKFSIV